MHISCVQLMEDSASVGFQSDESDLELDSWSYGDQGKLENEHGSNFDSFVSEEDKQCVGEFTSGLDVPIEPLASMAFNSRDEAKEFYVAYGRNIGFTVRIHHNRRSRVNNEVIGQDFVCSKEGFRAKKYLYRKDRVLPPPPVTREGCPAMIRLALRDESKWVVTKFIKEHNHKLMSPDKVPWRGSIKHLLSEDEKDRRIRELSMELYKERQRCKRQCAIYKEQLDAILKDLEQHTDHMSNKVADIVQRMKEIEGKSSDGPFL